MYDGYTESEEKIEARKRRILGTLAPTPTPPPEATDKRTSKEVTANEWLKRKLLTMAVLYPVAFFVGNLLGKLVAALGR